MPEQFTDNEKLQASAQDPLAAIMSKLLDSKQPQNPNPQSISENTGTSSGASDIFSALLSNPELLSKLPQILSVVKPLLESSQIFTQAPQSQKEIESAPASLISVKPQQHQKQTDNRSALLYAMKPYLGHDRQQAIDYIVKLGKLGEILKSL